MPKEWEKKEQFRDQRWELIESLIKEGMNSGFIRSIDLVILKAIFNAAMDEFFSQKFLAQNNLTSADAIKKMANILYYGMVVPRCDER